MNLRTSKNRNRERTFLKYFHTSFILTSTHEFKTCICICICSSSPYCCPYLRPVTRSERHLTPGLSPHIPPAISDL
jgi:hypothetical protein